MKFILFVVCPELDCARLKYSNVLNRLESPSLIHKFTEIVSNGNLNWSVNFVFDFWQERRLKVYT